MRTSTSLRLCRLAPSTSSDGVLAVHRHGAAAAGGAAAAARKRPVSESGLAHQLVRRALRDDVTAARAGAGPEVDDVLGAADGVLVVLDHHQRVAFGLELGQRVEQDAIVARVQADGGLVEDVAHAAQVGAELRGEPDALRLAAGQRRRGAVQREIATARRPAGRTGARSARRECRARSRLRGPAVADRGRSARPRPTGSAVRSAIERSWKRTCSAVGIQALAFARGAGLVDLQPLQPGIEHVVLGAGLLALLVPADAGRASGRCRNSVSHQPCLELKENSRGSSSGKLVPQDGQARLVENTASVTFGRALHQAIQRRDHMHHALAEVERARERLAQLGFVVGARRADPPPAARWCAPGSATGAATWPVGRNSPSTRRCVKPLPAPTSPGRCSSPCARPPAARAGRCAGRGSRAAGARRSTRSSAARSARRRSGQYCVPSLTNSRRRK